LPAKGFESIKVVGTFVAVAAETDDRYFFYFRQLTTPIGIVKTEFSIECQMEESSNTRTAVAYTAKGEKHSQIVFHNNLVFWVQN
jgi:hypothetical protein